MSMTREEELTQMKLSNELRKQGYNTYAELFELFEFWLTDNPKALGYMYPGEALMVINRNLEEKYQLLIIRHEIMHEYLTHQMDLINWLDKEHPELHGDKEALHKLYGSMRKDGYTLGNIAGDLDISNRAYTEEDKELLSHIEFNGQILSGLITERAYPGWENKPVEWMFAELVKEWNKMQQEIKNNPPQPPQGGEGGQPGQPEGDGEGEGGQGGSGGGQGQPGNSGGDQGGSQGSSGGGNQPSIRVIRGKLDNGRFYDNDGNDITPEIKSSWGN